MIMNIPLELWQTYKSSNLPRQAIPLVQSWKNKNPQLTVNFMDDAQCNHFIKQNFDDEFYQMYISLPFGVMRADVWRVAVVYINGGIYADTDTDCMVSISEWLKPDDRLVVAVEQSNGALANFIFAASPKHPALLHVLNTFREFYNSPNFLDTNTDTPIQNFGQHGFSHGILSYYGLEDNETSSYTRENVSKSILSHLNLSLFFPLGKTPYGGSVNNTFIFFISFSILKQSSLINLIIYF